MGSEMCIRDSYRSVPRRVAFHAIADADRVLFLPDAADARRDAGAVSYTHLTLPTSDLV